MESGGGAAAGDRVTVYPERFTGSITFIFVPTTGMKSLCIPPLSRLVPCENVTVSPPRAPSAESRGGAATVLLYRRRFARHAPHLPAIDFRTICILTPVCSHQPLPLHSLRVHFKHAALVTLRKAGIGCSVPRKRCRDHVACRPLWAPSETVTLHIRVSVCPRELRWAADDR